MTDGPPASNNEIYIHSWLLDIVEVHRLLLDKIVCFVVSDCGGAHLTFHLMLTYAVRRYGFRPVPSPVISTDRTLLLLHVGPLVHQFIESWAFLKTYKRNYAKRQLSPLAEFGGLTYHPSGSMLKAILHSMRPTPT
jgi:hypothetical protein